MNWKRNEGLTLVELMVAILVAAIITTAATTIMLLGLRVNRHSTETAQTQYTARTVLTVLENLASEGTIVKVEAHSNPNTWSVQDKDGNELLSYNDTDKAIFIGSEKDKTPLLKDVTASHILYTADGLLTFAMETGGETYTSSVYCRTLASDNVVQDTKEEQNTDPGTTDEHRLAFLQALLSQYDSVGGVILYGKDNVDYKNENYRFFSEWYVGHYNYEGAGSDWNYRTPWCACFISWGLAHYNVPNGQIKPPNGSPQWYANVETFKNNYFDSNLEKSHWNAQTADGRSDIIPGDLIFFDWENDGSLDHIGAVLLVQPETENNIQKTFVYTIEGNSANTVAIRKYAIDDPRINGYGVLPWPAN